MFTLPDLPYKYDALEPVIDQETMKIHHTKHHQWYTDKLNNALADSHWHNESIEKILQSLDELPNEIRTAVQNNWWGFYNHSLFWESMSPDGGGEPAWWILAEAITKTFWSFEIFKEKFSQQAAGVFWSGWARLCFDENGSLVILTTQWQNNPISNWYTPILWLDVWEHAYYLQYQNKRPDYIKARWDLVNRDVVQERFKQ